MSSNRLILNGENQEISLSFDVKVTGSSAAEVLTISTDANVEFGAGTGDQINLAGSANDYAISASGNVIQFTSLLDEGSVVINIGAASTIHFDEGDVALSFDFVDGAPQVSLGNAVIPYGETLEDPVAAIFGITGPVDVAMNELQNTTEDNPFDADNGAFIFNLDAAETLDAAITNFSDDDVLQFTNTPTGSWGDFSVSNPAIGDNMADVGVANVDITLLGIESDSFYNAETFTEVFGSAALVTA